MNVRGLGVSGQSTVLGSGGSWRAGCHRLPDAPGLPETPCSGTLRGGRCRLWGPSRTLGKSAFRAQLPHATSQWATMNVKEQAVYAIVRTSGHQEKVAVGDELLLNRLAEQPGASVEARAGSACCRR